MEKHSPFGPSSLGRLLKCPASLRLSKDDPPTHSKDAAEGTMLHRAFEKYWRQDPMWNDGLEPEQLELVEKAIEYVRRFTAIPGAKIWVERRVELIGDAGTVVNWGTADMVITTPTKQFVIDLKFGRKIDDDALVLQLAAYLAFLACGSDPGLDNWFEAWVFFPRLGTDFKFDHPGPAGKLVKEVSQKIDEIRELTADETLEATPGPHCDYCPHLGVCHAVTVETSRELAKVHDANLLADPARVCQLYDLGTLAEKQAKALRGRIREVLAENPKALPGLELNEVNGNRKTVSLMKLFMRVVPELLEKEEWDKLVTKDVKPTELEKAILAKFWQGRGKGKPTQVAIKKRLAEVVGDAVKAPKESRLRRVNV